MGIGVFAFVLAALLFVQFATPSLVGNDGYYHVKIGALMRQQGFKLDFIWLPLSILNPDAYYDHHFLYHVYLSLFVPFGTAASDPQALIIGGKIASALMPALAFTAIWWMLHQAGVRWAWLWAVGLLAVSDAFLFRMSMPRAQSASLLFLAVGLHLMFSKKYWYLVPLGFFYVWLYNAFPLLIIIACIYIAASFVTEHTIEWQPLAAVGTGIVLGLVVNPYFPQNITFIVNHVLPKIGAPEVQVGGEWYPYETWTLVENSAGALAAVVVGMLALGWNEKRIDRHTLTALLLAVLFGLMVFKSRRFVEYYPAFALIFMAFAVSRLELEEQFNFGKYSKWVVPGLFLLFITYPLIRTLQRTHESIADSRPPDYYADAATWLSENTEPQSFVFQTDWDDFTRLFFYNANSIYTIGLDTTYMQLYDAELYENWVNITRGNVVNPGSIIATRYGGDYVFSDLDHDEFIATAQDDPLLEEIYRDDYAVIYRVNY